MDAPKLELPRLYPILDRDVVERCGLELVGAAQALVDAGCTQLQYRNKSEAAGIVLGHAQRLREQLPSACLILNDRVDLARLTGFDGAHVGQTDLAAADARRVLAPEQLLGLSTHSLEQFRVALPEPVDYIAIGPIFSTTSKLDADPVVGLELVRAARALTKKPIVAIGGITAANAPSVIEAGADSVAVISDLFAAPRNLAYTARSLLRTLA